MASLEPIRTFPAREQQISKQNKHATKVLPLPRRACTQQLAQNQAQIERAHMDQLPLENVFVSAQMAAPQSARFVTMREAALDQLGARRTLLRILESEGAVEHRYRDTVDVGWKGRDDDRRQRHALSAGMVG